MQSTWLPDLLKRAADPLINGAFSLVVAIIAGLVISLIFRLVAGPVLNRIFVPFFARCDDILVRRIAPLTGIGLGKTWMRWSAFLGVFLVLALTATFAPVPVALGAVLVGIVVVLAIYRAWERDEQEREVIEERGQKAPDGNDLGNEIMVGLAFLIVFFTLGFDRVAQQQTIYTGTPVYPIATTAGFIWGEVLKAIPLVDASEVFGLSNVSGVEATGSVGRTLTFVFRVFLDLLLIGALIRLVGLLSRQASGKDIRHLRERLRTGDKIAFDQAFQKLAAFAMEGNLNSRNLMERIALREFDSPRLQRPAIVIRAVDVLFAVGEKFRSRRFYPIIIDASRYVLESLSPEKDPERWQGMHMRLGLAQYELGMRGGGNQPIRDALETYQAALRHLSLEEDPEAWAAMQRQIGTILALLGSREEDAELLRQAIEAFRANQSVNTLEVNSKAWTAAQGEISSATLNLAFAIDSRVPLEDLVSSFDPLIQQYDKETHPKIWFDLQTMRAVCLMKLAFMAREPERYAEAIASVDVVISYFTETGDEKLCAEARRLSQRIGEMASMSRHD